MEPKFKIGNIVKLKSGSPEMTIDRIPWIIGPQGAELKYKTVWFDGYKNYEANYSEDSLILVK